MLLRLQQSPVDKNKALAGQWGADCLPEVDHHIFWSDSASGVMKGDFAHASDLSLRGRVEQENKTIKPAMIFQGLAVKDLMTVDLSDSMWYNSRVFKSVPEDDRQAMVHQRHTETHERWHSDGYGAMFVATTEKGLLVLYIDCFAPPWIGTGNIRHGTIALKDFGLKALLLHGRVGRYRDIDYVGQPQCVHFGPGALGQFQVSNMIVRDALGLDDDQFTSDAQLPPTQIKNKKRYVFALPDLRFYPLALRVEQPDAKDPTIVNKMTFHKVTGPSVPHSLSQAGLATSVAALP